MEDCAVCDNETLEKIVKKKGYFNKAGDSEWDALYGLNGSGSDLETIAEFICGFTGKKKRNGEKINEVVVYDDLCGLKSWFYGERLLLKMEKEQEEYVNALAGLTAGEVIEKAREYVLREDILGMFRKATPERSVIGWEAALIALKKRKPLAGFARSCKNADKSEYFYDISYKIDRC